MARIIISPDKFSALTINSMKSGNNIINPIYGITKLGTNTNVIIEGGKRFSTRFQKAFSGGDLQHITDSTTVVTAQTQNQKETEAIGIMETLAVAESQYDVAIIGEETLTTQFGGQFAAAITDRMETYLATGTKALFGSATATPFTDTYAGINLTTIMAAKTGNWPKTFKDVKSIIVHPDIYAKLASSTAATSQDTAMFADGQILKIGGLAVIPNDVMCEKYDDGGTDKYKSYLTKKDAFQVDVQRQTRIATVTSTTGGITDTLAISTTFMAIPTQGSWVATVGTDPNLTNYAITTNWAFSYFDEEDVAIREMVTPL